MRVLKVLLLIASLAAFVLGFIFGKIYLYFCAIPFLAFLFIAIHECGHVIGCLLVKTKVNSVETFGFVFYKPFEISKNISFFGKVNFDKTEKDKVVFIFGIITSLIVTAVSIILFVFNLLNIVYFITICLCMVAILIPYKGSDVWKVFSKK